MSTTFTAEILKFKTIHELPNAWNNNQYIALLDAMSFDNPASLKPEELKEMCMMALAENEPNEAAKFVLDYIIGDRLNEGQKDNLSHEMIDEKMWEEYAEIVLHEEFFNMGQLLYQSYNGKFPQPEAVRFEVKISGKHNDQLELFSNHTETGILRTLTPGMGPNTLINRLYKEELKTTCFEEAENIIWQYKEIESTDTSITYEIISSLYWFHDLKFIEGFEVTLEDVE